MPFYNLLPELLRDLAGDLDPSGYVRSLELEPYDWQQDALTPDLKRLILLTARQSGKSTVVAGKAIYKAKHRAGSLILIICPAQDQSKELMKKIEFFISRDRRLVLTHDAAFEKELGNGSRIVALPGSERSVRSYSGPSMIIIDEAARVQDATYRAARPMMVGADTELVLMSTPFGQRGFFWETWEYGGPRWRKILVVPAFQIREHRIVPAPPLAEFRKRFPGKAVYYSSRHTREFLEEELNDIRKGEFWVQQEHMCEFINPAGSLFKPEDLLRAVNDGIQPLEKDPARDGIEVLDIL